MYKGAAKFRQSVKDHHSIDIGAGPRIPKTAKGRASALPDSVIKIRRKKKKKKKNNVVVSVSNSQITAPPVKKVKTANDPERIAKLAEEIIRSLGAKETATRRGKEIVLVYKPGR